MQASQHGKLKLQQDNVDTLLESLLYIGKFFDCISVKEPCTTNIPLFSGRVRKTDLTKLAANLGLTSHQLFIPFDKISALLLPCIIELENHEFCVLLEVNKADGLFCIMQPQVNKNSVWLEREKIDRHVTGQCYFFTKQVNYASIKKETLKLQRRQWFWGTFIDSISIYRDVLFASLLINIFALIGPIFTMNVLDKIIPNLAYDSLWALATGAWVFFIFDFIIKSLRRYFIDIAGKKSDVLLSALIYRKVLGMRLEHRPGSVGAFTKHLQGFESIREFFTSLTISVLLDLPFILLFVAVIGWLSGWMGLLVIVAICILVLYNLVHQKPLIKSITQGAKLATQQNASLIESLAYIETIKLCGAESQFQLSWEQVASQISGWAMQTRRLTDSVAAFTRLIQQAVTIALIVLGVYQIGADEISLGGLIAIVMLSSRSFAPMAQLSAVTVLYHQAKQAMVMIENIINLPSELEEEQEYQVVNQSPKRIKFKNVSFTYPTMQEPAIQGLNLTIKWGEKIAIMGGVGSGKTTLQRMFAGLYLPTAGTVLCDGIDLTLINRNQLRQYLGVVSQDDHLFYGSIRDNIILRDHFASEQAILNAAMQSGVLDFTCSDPEGLAKQVGEGGRLLSGGQRQSVLVARALLNQPKMLILDEPSSCMDRQTEHNLKTQLQRLTRDVTLIITTHNAEMLDAVDRLIIMDAGKIIADGKKDIVLSKLTQGKIRTHKLMPIEPKGGQGDT